MTASVSFTTVVAENEDGVRALIEKYHDPQVSARAFALASTHSEIELRHLGVSRDEEARFQRLAARVIFADPRLRSPESAMSKHRHATGLVEVRNFRGPPDRPRDGRGRRGGGACPGTGARPGYLRARGFTFDLIILNELPTSYREDVQEELQRIADSGPSHVWLDRPGGLFLRSVGRVSPKRIASCCARSRARYSKDRAAASRCSFGGRCFRRRFRRAIKATPAAGHERDTPLTALPQDELGVLQRVWRIHVAMAAIPHLGAASCSVVQRRGERPFGFVATDSGLGNTWSENSYQNRLRPGTTIR